MKNRKKKHFKLVKHNHKQLPKGGVILQPSDQQAECIINLYRNIIKEAPSLKPILEYQKENLEKEKAFDKYLDEWFDNINSEPTFTMSSAFKVEALTLKEGETFNDVFKENESISNLKEALIKSAKECAERLKLLTEIELQNQNHKPT